MSAVAHFGTGDSTSASAASGTSVAVAKPANVAVGDLLVGNFYSQFSGAAPTGLSAWTLISAHAFRSGGVYYIAVTDSTVLAGLAASWTPVFAGGGRMAHTIFRVTGADLTAPIDAFSAGIQTATNPLVLNAVTAVNSAALLIAVPFWNNSSTTISVFTPPAGMTDGQQVASPATGNTSGTEIAYEQLSASGTTGTRSFTMTPAGASNGGYMFTIKPAAGVAASAPFSGSGTMTATVVQNYPVAAAFSGSGTLTATVTNQTASASAPFSGSGTFTASTAGNVAASADFSGSGSFTTTVVQKYAVTAPLSGSGTFAATAVQKYAVTAPFSGSGTFSASWQTAVQKWISTQPLYAAHRGGSADWPQSTMFAYDQAAAWNKDLALEVSIWPSSDGHWWVNHDDTLGTTGQWNSSAQITTSTDAVLKNVATTVGGYPLLPLVPIAGVSTPDLLSKYGGKRVIIIDNKGSLDVSGLISILNANGGPAWYVSKSYYTSVAWAGGMRTAGYYTLGYYYDADTPQIASTQSKFDVLMEDYTATTASWNTILSYPQPVMAHIVPDAAAKATAISKGAEGFMASGVMEVVPSTANPASFSGSGTFTATVVQKYSLAAAYSGSGSLTASASQQYSVSTPFSGSGTVTVSVSQNYAASAQFSGSGTFTASATTGLVILANFSGAGTFTADLIQHYMATAPFSGSGTFTVVASTGPGEFAVYVWDGSHLIAASIGVWNGTSVVPAEVTEIA